MFSPKAVILCLQIWALWFWLSLQIWNFENIFHSLTSNNWIKYSELCLPCYLMIFNRFFDPIIGSLIHNSINLVMFPFYNWHLSSSQSLKLIEDLFCDTLLPNIGSFDSKIELVDDYFLQCSLPRKGSGITWWFSRSFLKIKMLQIQSKFSKECSILVSIKTWPKLITYLFF